MICGERNPFSLLSPDEITAYDSELFVDSRGSELHPFLKKKGSRPATTAVAAAGDVRPKRIIVRLKVRSLRYGDANSVLAISVVRLRPMTAESQV
jgi:hypothetical protein